MKTLNKIISVLLVFLLVSSLLPSTLANAAQGENQSIKIFDLEEQKDIEATLDEELTQELNTVNSDELEIEVADVTSDAIVVESSYEDKDINVNIELEFDYAQETIVMETKHFEGNETLYGEYEIEVVDINEDESYILNFIDLKTGEEHTVDSTQVQASAVPILVYMIGAQVVRVTITHVGKKAVLKIGSKTFQKKTKDAAIKATSNFSTWTTKAGGKTVTFSKAKMQHVLKNHHPNYWTGASGKSMFDPKLNVNDVKNIVTKTINSNKTTIGNALKKGNSVNVYKTINGIKYKVNIGKDGYVKTAHPV